MPFANRPCPDENLLRQNRVKFNAKGSEEKWMRSVRFLTVVVLVLLFGILVFAALAETARFGALEGVRMKNAANASAAR